MSENPIKLFRVDFENYTSQDNKGYYPDRGSFKAGWFSCYHRFQHDLKKLESAIEVIKYYSKFNFDKQSMWNDRAVLWLKENGCE